MTSAVNRPSLDGRPVPGGSSPDGEVGFGEQTSLPPLVDGPTANAEPFGNLNGSNRITGHASTVNKVLTTGKGCIHNVDMTYTISHLAQHADSIRQTIAAYSAPDDANQRRYWQDRLDDVLASIAILDGTSEQANRIAGVRRLWGSQS